RASSEENSCADPFSCAALPPLLPACRASSEENSCAEPFRCAAWPPLLAISRCFASSMEPKPRLPLAGICRLLESPVASAGINLADRIGQLSSGLLASRATTGGLRGDPVVSEPAAPVSIRPAPGPKRRRAPARQMSVGGGMALLRGDCRLPQRP